MRYSSLLFGCFVVFAGLVTAEGLRGDEASLVLFSREIVMQDTIPTGSTRVVHIVHADSVRGYVEDGERLRRLFGNVHLRQDDTDLRAHQAIQYLDREIIDFSGNVEIADPTDTLRAAWVSYDSRLRVGRARGNVQLSDDEAVLDSDSLIFYRAQRWAVFEAPVRLVEREGGGVMTSRRGEYFTERKEAFFRDDVRLVDSTSVLTSDFGRYGTEDKRADFSGNVFLVHEDDTRMRADSLSHYRDINQTFAYGDVVILRFGGREERDEEVPPDTTQRTLLFGGFAFHDEEAEYTRVERGLQTVDPVVVRLSTDSLGVTDSLLVQARIFEAVQLDSLDGRPLAEHSTLQRVYARGDVHMHGDRLAALADSAVVDRIEFDEELNLPVEDEIRLFVDPIGWMNNRGSTLYTQVTGDTLVARARDESLDSLFVHGNAFAIRPDSVLERNNQIRGRTMLAVFEDDLRGIRVWPNAEALFFRADSLDRLEGGMRISGDSLSFVFRDDDLERITGVRSPEGMYYDAAILPSPFRLEGPPYRPENRPTRELILSGRPPLEDPFSQPYVREIPEEESEADVRTFFDLIREDDEEPPPDDIPEDDIPHD